MWRQNPLNNKWLCGYLKFQKVPYICGLQWRSAWWEWVTPPPTLLPTDLQIYILDAVPPVYVVWNHADTDKLTTANGVTFSVANHAKARQSLIERSVTWLATESGWARCKRSAICSGKLCGGFIIFQQCCPVLLPLACNAVPLILFPRVSPYVHGLDETGKQMFHSVLDNTSKDVSSMADNREMTVRTHSL